MEMMEERRGSGLCPTKSLLSHILSLLPLSLHLAPYSQSFCLEGSSLPSLLPLPILSLPSLPLPSLPSSPFPPFPYPFLPLIQLQGLGERCELPQRGPGQSKRKCKRIFGIFWGYRKRFWWQWFWYTECTDGFITAAKKQIIIFNFISMCNSRL